MLAAFCLPVALADAAEPQQIRLWEGPAPLAVGDEPKDTPVLTVAFPDFDQPDRPRSAVVICPGGGYGNLAMDHEGRQIADWAASLGMVTAICDYRHRGKGYGHPAPLLDAQRAIRLVRQHAADWNVDPQRVGIIGFSAGGHLASTVLTHHRPINPDGGFAEAATAPGNSQGDPIDGHSSRPDFGILCYPVIGMGVDFTHGGSQKNLFGDSPDPQLLAQFSNHQHVDASTPPTFLFHTQEDKAVPVRGSLEFYGAMVRHGVPGELHVFQNGRHGVGLAGGIAGTEVWPSLAAAWLRNLAMIP